MLSWQELVNRRKWLKIRAIYTIWRDFRKSGGFRLWPRRRQKYSPDWRKKRKCIHSRQERRRQAPSAAKAGNSFAAKMISPKVEAF
jgi:hypothetical protein